MPTGRVPPPGPPQTTVDDASLSWEYYSKLGPCQGVNTSPSRGTLPRAGANEAVRPQANAGYTAQLFDFDANPLPYRTMCLEGDALFALLSPGKFHA
ncbi:hypothetical protein E4U55_005084 [Claviceps digitariae]|nr:hypothetical protein E4U55_005084 [Claviceps digitariae]